MNSLLEPLGLTGVGAADIIWFALLGGMTLFSALFTVTRRNPVTAVMSLVATFFALAGVYATLQAHFLAVLQVMVYAGAIMVLFIFVVMILNREEVEPVSFRGIFTRALGVVAMGYLVLVFARIVIRFRETAPLAATGTGLSPDFGTVAGAGMSLFRDFVFPFEAISLLLLVAIVGGIIVSRSSKQEEQAEETARRMAAVRASTRDEARLGAVPDAGADHGHSHAAHH